MPVTENASDRIDPMWGKRLLRVRTNSGLSQSDFAVRLGFPKRSFVFWEMGEREPPYKLLIALYREFKIDPVWMLEGPGDEPIEYSRDLDGKVLEQTFDMVDNAIHSADLRASKQQRFELAAKAYPLVAEAPERAARLLKAALELLRRKK